MMPSTVTGPLAAELLHGGLSNLTFRLSDGPNSWILRTPPQGSLLQSAHDMAREFRVLNALHGGPVPVPRPLFYSDEEGVPYYVMEEVPGVVYRDVEEVATLAERERAHLGAALIDSLVALHSVRPHDIGLEHFGKPAGFLTRQLDRWTAQFAAVKTRDLPAVDRLAHALRGAMPQAPNSGLVHGDYRIDNVMFAPDDPGRVMAVLDWELATLGDPLTDLGTLISFWDEPGQPFNPITSGLMAFDGFPTRREAIDRYARSLDATVGELDWYVVFSLLKQAVILEQIHARHHEDADGSRNSSAGAMVPTLLDQALETAASSTLPALRRV